MDFKSLPKPLQNLLLEQYEEEMRSKLVEFHDDILLLFLEEDKIAKLWSDYIDEIFASELQESDYWAEWLAAHEVTLASDK